MKTLSKNKTRFFYAKYKDKIPEVDEYGNETGEYKVVYDDPIECFANISAARGETQTRQFGENELYDKIIVMEKGLAEIDEYCVIWVDNNTPNAPHDYIVKKVAESLNSVSIAVCKVNVDG